MMMNELIDEFVPDYMKEFIEKYYCNCSFTSNLQDSIMVNLEFPGCLELSVMFFKKPNNGSFTFRTLWFSSDIDIELIRKYGPEKGMDLYNKIEKMADKVRDLIKSKKFEYEEMSDESNVYGDLYITFKKKYWNEEDLYDCWKESVFVMSEIDKLI